MGFDWTCVVTTSGIRVHSEDLHRFEEAIGFDLPDDYRSFLLKFNGGEVIVDHDIRLPGIAFNIGVNYLFPLTAPSPFMGIIEARDIQVRHRLCLRQALEI